MPQNKLSELMNEFGDLPLEEVWKRVQFQSNPQTTESRISDFMNQKKCKNCGATRSDEHELCYTCWTAIQAHPMESTPPLVCKPTPASVEEKGEGEKCKCDMNHANPQQIEGDNWKCLYCGKDYILIPHFKTGDGIDIGTGYPCDKGHKQHHIESLTEFDRWFIKEIRRLNDPQGEGR